MADRRTIAVTVIRQKSSMYPGLCSTQLLFTGTITWARNTFIHNHTCSSPVIEINNATASKTNKALHLLNKCDRLFRLINYKAEM